MGAWRVTAEGSWSSTPQEPHHVCLLMHVGAAQARTRLQERQHVRPAAPWGRFHPAQHVCTVPQVKYRVLGR